MRIIQVSSHYLPHHTGGAERCCAGLARTLVDAGHQVTVLAPVPKAEHAPVRIRSLPVTRSRTLRKLLFDYAAPGATAVLGEVMRDFDPDIVHFHNIYGIGSRLIHVAAAHQPTVVTLHDYWPMDVLSPSYRDGALAYPAKATLLRPLAQLHRRMHRHHLSRAQLVAPSHFLAERVGAALDRDIAVIPNGFYQPDTTSVSEPAILFVGRLVRDKGLDIILPVAARLAHAAGWRIDILGEGPQRQELEQTFPDVRFHGWTEPAPFYERSSILLVPSIWPENAPYVVLEGMGRGLAVLASAAGGIPEMLREGETGLLHTPGEPESFKRALTRLLSDGRLRSALGDAAREQVAANGWSHIAGQYHQVYAAAQQAWEHSRSAVRSATDADEEGVHV